METYSVFFSMVCTEIGGLYQVIPAVKNKVPVVLHHQAAGHFGCRWYYVERRPKAGLSPCNKPR